MPDKNSPTKGFTISGIIHDKYDYPLAGVKVQAIDVDLRSEQVLGEAITDVSGAYLISYTSQQFVANEYQGPDIKIKIPNDKIGVHIPQSQIYFNVQPNTVINFKIDNTPFKELNEFAILLQKVQPFIKNGVALGILLQNETYQDINFIAGDLEEDIEKITFLNNAFFNSINTKIPAGIYYGLFRTGIPCIINSLLNPIDSKTLVIHIVRATDLNIISSQFLDEIIDIIEKFSLIKNPAL